MPHDHLPVPIRRLLLALTLGVAAYAWPARAQDAEKLFEPVPGSFAPLLDASIHVSELDPTGRRYIALTGMDEGGDPGTRAYFTTIEGWAAFVGILFTHVARGALQWGDYDGDGDGDIDLIVAGLAVEGDMAGGPLTRLTRRTTQIYQNTFYPRRTGRTRSGGIRAPFLLVYENQGGVFAQTAVALGLDHDETIRIGRPGSPDLLTMGRTPEGELVSFNLLNQR